jgi:hypothetical protein
MVFDVNTGAGLVDRLTLDSTGATIYSADASDSISIYHDNTNANMLWSDGGLFLITTETNGIGVAALQGNGTGYGEFRVYDEDDGEYTRIRTISGVGQLTVLGTSPQRLDLQPPADIPITLFVDAASGDTPTFSIFGFKAGDSKRSAILGISSTYDDTFEMDGVSNFRFDGQVEAEIAGTAGVVDVFKASAIGNKGAGRGVALIFHPPDSSSATLGGRIACNREGATLDTYLSFQTHDGAAMGERVRITSDGYLGVGVTPAQKFEIGSTDNSDRISIYHDNTTAYMKWNDGSLILQTDEGTNTESRIEIKGKGTGKSTLLLWDNDEAEYFFPSRSGPQQYRFFGRSYIWQCCKWRN